MRIGSTLSNDIHHGDETNANIPRVYGRSVPFLAQTQNCLTVGIILVLYKTTRRQTGVLHGTHIILTHDTSYNRERPFAHIVCGDKPREQRLPKKKKKDRTGQDKQENRKKNLPQTSRRASGCPSFWRWPAGGSADEQAEIRARVAMNEKQRSAQNHKETWATKNTTIFTILEKKKQGVGSH